MKHHFANEEAMLRAMGYPGLPGQVTQHARFVADLARLSATAAPQSRVALGVLKDWMLDHVLGMDRAYTKWMNERGEVERVRRSA